MPELPEVEVTRRGIEEHLKNKTITKIISRQKKLRWPIPTTVLKKKLVGRKVHKICRRGKYLLLNCGNGWLIVHLGMSGTLRIVPEKTSPEKHDHFEIWLNSKFALKFNDPRRFGAILWESEDPQYHPLIKSIAPEPFCNSFNKNWLFDNVNKRNASIKSLIMNSSIVAGVGNIYANESLHKAGIHPLLPGKMLSKDRCHMLVKAIKITLKSAIKHGGSSLQDYVNIDGLPGYFQQKYLVYNRKGMPCKKCNRKISKQIHLQRATYFCEKCQI